MSPPTIYRIGFEPLDLHVSDEAAQIYHVRIVKVIIFGLLRQDRSRKVVPHVVEELLLVIQT